MFKNAEAYKEYLNRRKIDKIDIGEENYFKVSDDGEVIIKKGDYIESSIYVENYANCIKWILLKDKKTMALLKHPFGDVYRNLTTEQYYISLYNNILLPQIAEKLQNECAKYYIAKGNNARDNRRYLLTIDFKEGNEEIIHGEDLLEDVGGDINELNINNIIECIEKYLVKIGGKNQEIETIKKEFIKQSLFNRFVKQSDENNHNWGILINTQNNRVRIAPIYDLDCCCDVGTTKKHIRTTQDDSKYSMSSFINDFGKHEWFITYIKEILEDFDLNKAIKESKETTGIEIPQNIQEKYKTFFGERYYELKSAYQEYIEAQKNINKQEQYIER